jgi:hypothetical protein
LTGRTVMSQEISSKTIINTASLSPGVYLICAESKGEKCVKKFIKY